MFETIDISAARELINNDPDIIVLDVRRDDEYYGPGGHIKNSIHIPIEELQSRVKELEQYKDKKILTFCYAGHRSQKACTLLAKCGYENLYNVMGGMMEWEDNNFPTEVA